jgi:hypothetical protein
VWAGHWVWLEWAESQEIAKGMPWGNLPGRAGQKPRAQGQVPRQAQVCALPSRCQVSPVTHCALIVTATPPIHLERGETSPVTSWVGIQLFFFFFFGSTGV